MPNSAQVRCSCGQILKQPVPRICPGCIATNFGRPKTQPQDLVVVYRLSLAHVRNIAGFDSVSGQPI